MKDKSLEKFVSETSLLIANVFDEYKIRHSEELGYVNYHFEGDKLVANTK